MKPVPNSAAWFTVVRIAWARRRPSSLVVSARLRKTAPSERFRVVPDHDGGDEHEREPVPTGERGQGIERRRRRAAPPSPTASGGADPRCPTFAPAGTAVTSIGT